MTATKRERTFEAADPFDSPQDVNTAKRQKISPTLDSKTLALIFSIATTPEGAAYVAVRLSLHETFAGVAYDFAVGVAAQQAIEGGHWTGVPGSSDFEKFQGFLGAKAADTIRAEVGDDAIIFNFALSDLSEYIRGCSAGGKKLEEAIMAAFDKLYNSWLAEHGMVTEGSIIYMADEAGNIQKDGKGQKVKADKERILELMRDPEKGFEKFCDDKGIKGEAREQKYPEQQTAAQRAETTKTQSNDVQQRQEVQQHAKETVDAHRTEHHAQNKENQEPEQSATQSSSGGGGR